MQDLIFYNGSASLNVNLYGKYLLIFSFIYLFVSLSAHAIVHAYKVLVFKKYIGTCRSSGPRVFLLLQRSCSKCMDTHAHADLELCWSHVFLDAITYFM